MTSRTSVEAARVIGEHVGNAAVLGSGDVLDQLRHAVRHAEAVDVLALRNADGFPYRMIVRAFALVGDEPIGGTFIVDDQGFRRVDADALFLLFPEGHRWVGLPLEAIAAMPQGVLLGMRAIAPNLALALRALQQTAS